MSSTDREDSQSISSSSSEEGTPLDQFSDLGVTLVSPIGHSKHDCGYCKGKDTSVSFGIWAHSMSCEDYQSLIDRGWRRSGKYLYKPDLEKSCCPQYTIRLDTARFNPTKSQKKVINKVTKYIKGSWSPQASSTDNTANNKTCKKGGMKPPPPKKPSNYVQTNSLRDLIHEPENTTIDNEYELKVELEPSSFTKEKYQLYAKYQEHVHHDKPEDMSERGFKRFLVDSPLELEKDGPNGISYGSFHQKYLLNGKLFALAVIDILPKCVSSVYFLYDPDYSFLGLGKYSAFREIALVQEMNEKSSQLQHYYMGYYIHTCPKMNYKGQYQPSDLLDPIDYKWHPIQNFIEKFDQGESFVTFDPDDRSKGRTYPPGWLNPKTITKNILERIYVLIGQAQVAPVIYLVKFESSSKFRELITDYTSSVGLELAEKFILIMLG